jgi:23S rRNA-/tRNA-specific pseudouridylate synthase
LVNYAARYALEGRVNTIHSAYHVKIQNVNTIDGLKAKIMEEINKYRNRDSNEAKFGSNSEPIDKLYEDNKYLIVIDKCRGFIQSDRWKFNEAIHE